MTSIDSGLFARLRSLYPAAETDTGDRTWALVAACAFSAANAPEAVPRVFEYAIEGEASHEERLRFARKMRDALFKSGMLSGYPKAINGLVKLHESTPEDLRDKAPLRSLDAPNQELQKTGEALFASTYGEKTNAVSALVHDIYPDFGYFCMTFAYGFVYGPTVALGPAETSFAMVAALIAVDVPTQIDWHLQGARRHGASIAQIRAVREIAIEASRAAGATWKNTIPEVLEK
ncbi:AhpD-like protein [Schizophyllum amplum]|uniref:AhpD-like protein n=1 Tax=Schizophyllum amplum TaxID=97359 RepID=A0A550C088_9AGAR|nr:AhpD-like protein [Auriculariopsis ampla]